MPIRTIVTRGFGSFAGTKYVPTRGYVSTTAPPPPIFPVRPAWADLGGFAGSSGMRRLALHQHLNHPQLHAEREKIRVNKEEEEIMNLLLKIGYDMFFDD